MKKCVFVLALLFAFALSSCTYPSAPQTRVYYDYFDTVITVTGCDGDFDATCEKIEEILKKYHGLCDIYTDGVLKTVNETAGTAPVTVPDELFDLLVYAKDAHAKTNGKCNVAFGAVTSVWHEYRSRALDGDVAVPSADELRLASEHTDIDDLALDREKKTVYFLDPELKLDLGAFAKGWVADVIVNELRSLGKTNYAVSVGGTVTATGPKPNGDGWMVGVENPSDGASMSYTARVSVADGFALATSGSYQRYYEADGVRYHHIIDTETLMPENELLSVTVAAPTAALADVLSTAVFCMSVEDGKALAEELGVELLWVLSDGTVIMTDDFPKMK